MGHCDTMLSALQFCFWVSLLGVSAAAIKQIKDHREAGDTSICYVQSELVWRETIGILAVSCAAVVHSIITVILGAAKQGAVVRYSLNLCILPHAIILVALGSIVLAWTAPESFAGARGGSVRTFVLDTCQKEQPFAVTFAAGAMAVAFGGFVLLFVPACLIIACVADIKENPKAHQFRNYATAEAKAVAPGAIAGATAAGATSRRDVSYDETADEESGYEYSGES
jgi:hypothetical protein